MKRLLTSTALVAVIAVPALAQQQPTNQSANSPFYASSQENADLRASEYIGTRVYTSGTNVGEDYAGGVDENWESVGQINDVLLSREGEVQAILVDVGGFLGIGAKTVAVSLDELRIVSETADPSNYSVVFTSSREALENAPEWTDPDIGSAEGANQVDSEMNNPAVAQTGATGTTDPAMGMADGNQRMGVTEPTGEGGPGDLGLSPDTMTGAGENMAGTENRTATGDPVGTDNSMTGGSNTLAETGASTETGTGGNTAGGMNTANSGQGTTTGTSENVNTAQSGEGLATGGAEDMDTADSGQEATTGTAGSMDTAQSGGAVATGNMNTDQANMDSASEPGQTRGSTDNVVAQDGTGPNVPAGGAEMDTASGFTAPDIQREGFATAKADALNTDTLTGARVYDVNDDWIGEVSDLMVDDQGKITDAVIQVGGFLGIGEKPVAMNFEALNIQQQNEGEEIRVYLDATEEELESMPSYEEQ